MKTSAILLVLIYISIAQIPPSFKKCNRNQANFGKCVLEAAQNALPQLQKYHSQLNFPNIEPVLVDLILLKPGSLELKLKSCKVYGLTQGNFQKFKIDFKEKSFSSNINFPSLLIQCGYQMSGKILFLPAAGNGDVSMNFTNLHLSAKSLCDYMQKDGQTFVRLISNTIASEPESLHLNFKNLFNGNEVLGQNLNQVVNDNWKEIYGVVRPGVHDVFKSVLSSLLKAFFGKVSLEELFD